MTALGDKAYILGGQTYSYDYQTEYLVQVNASAGTLTTIKGYEYSANFGRCEAASESVGQKAYFFGGYRMTGSGSGNTKSRTVQVYDKTLNNFSSLGELLPYDFWSQVSAVVDHNIFLFGNGPSGANIIKFDTTTNLAEQLDATLPTTVSSGTAIAVGDQIYIFKSSSTQIIRFDANTYQSEILDTVLGSSYASVSAEAIGNTIYLFTRNTVSNTATISVLEINLGEQMTIKTLTDTRSLDSRLALQNEAIETLVNNALDTKQDKLTAGTGISISGSTISSYNTLVAGEGISIDGDTIKTTINNYLRFEGSAPSSYEVIDLGTTYGFSLNSNGYYQSDNKGVNSSYAICKVQFNLAVAQDIVIDCINYAESTYDYGLLSQLDATLASNASADSSNVYKNFSGSQSSSVVKVTYSNVSAGSHFIYIKFIKDGSQNSNNDTLQFKINDLISVPANTTIITDGTNTLDLSQVGHGVEIIDISGLDTIPEEYQDFEKLKTCYLRSGSLIYRLSYDGTSDDSGLYYENSDELYYNYLRITSNFNIEGNPDGVGNKQIATQD